MKTGLVQRPLVAALRCPRVKRVASTTRAQRRPYYSIRDVPNASGRPLHGTGTLDDDPFPSLHVVWPPWWMTTTWPIVWPGNSIQYGRGPQRDQRLRGLHVTVRVVADKRGRVALYA